MGAPYASRTLVFHLLIALSVAFIAVYRAELYQLPASAWALAAAVGFLGFFVPWGVPTGLRASLLGGRWPLVIVVPFVGLLLSPRLIPSPVMVGPFLLCAAAAFSTCLVVLWNTSRRRRAVRRLLERPEALEPGVRSRLESYFTAVTPLVEGTSNRSKPLQRALRAQAWLPGRRHRAHAAALLRECVEFQRKSEADWTVPPPSEVLQPNPEAADSSSERVHAALLGGAAKLENGGRIRRWKSWLLTLYAPDVDAGRECVFSLDCLARRHHVQHPGWFRTWRRNLACAPLTDTDLAPPWKVAVPLAKPATALLAVMVLASALLSTATAQTPLDDSRQLPVIAGPSGASRIEPRLSQVVTSLAGRRAQVRCWSHEDWQRLAAQRTSWLRRSQPRLGRWSGYVSNGRVQLAPAVCASLARLTYGRSPVDRDLWPTALAWSVSILAHEAQHIKGISNEAKAECYGMQSITLATKVLGRTEWEGRYLASLYWERAYHRHRNPKYMSDDCRDGGDLDLRPSVDAWP
jgi:hypothetical protein